MTPNEIYLIDSLCIRAEILEHHLTEYAQDIIKIQFRESVRSRVDQLTRAREKVEKLISTLPDKEPR